MKIAGVYAIVDLPHPAGLPAGEIAAALVAGGARILQLRAKRATPEQRRVWAEALAEPCLAAGVPLIVNDDLALAESGLPGIAGVHLGQEDLLALAHDLRTRRDRLREQGIALGISTHDLDQLRRAIRDLDPDYLGFGPVFATSSKQNPDPVVGLAGLARACGESPVPIVAIGGIDPKRAREVVFAGAAAIAVIGALAGGTVEIIRAKTASLVAAI